MNETCKTFVSGRNNLSATVFIPHKCENNCKFCDVKNEYTNGINLELIKQRLNEISQSTIKSVVFTGGEPTQDLNILKELVDIVSNKIVYINTTFLKDNMDEFIDFLYNTSNIKGINISRHAINYESEKLKNIAEDKYILLIPQPVKINVVLPNDCDIKFILNVVNRWKEFENDDDYKISFRTDYRKTTSSKLHDLTDPMLQKMLNVGTFIKRSYCDVCDTTDIKINNILCSYHRGLELTSIDLGWTIQVNDIIVFPNGDLCYDWDHKICESSRWGGSRLNDAFQIYDFSNEKNSCGSGGC